MENAYLVRTEMGDEGTFGSLRLGDFLCVTGELPWRNNRRDISCIPDGEYICTRRRNFGGAPCWKVEPVVGRSGILVHLGNWCGDVLLSYISKVKGCVLLGKKLGVLKGQKAVISSGDALREFAKVAPDRFMLHVLSIHT